MIFAPTLWNVPTRSRPASPASSALMSAFAARSRAWIASAWRSRIWPASVSEIGRGPARTLDEAQPDDALERRDLLRDGRLRVAEPLGRAPERALVGDRLERDEMPEVEPEPAISFHDRKVAASRRLIVRPRGSIGRYAPARDDRRSAGRSAFARARCAARRSTSSSSRSCSAGSATRRRRRRSRSSSRSRRRRARRSSTCGSTRTLSGACMRCLGFAELERRRARARVPRSPTRPPRTSCTPTTSSTTTSSSARGRATRSRSSSRTRSSAGRTAPGSARSAGRT